MYLDGYVTSLVPSTRGSRLAGADGRKPAPDAGSADRRPGNRGRAGGVAAYRPPRGITALAGAAGGGTGRGPPGGAAAGLQPPPAAARRDRPMAGQVPGPLGTAAGRPAHRDSPRQTRTKENQMTGDAGPGTRILGS